MGGWSNDGRDRIDWDGQINAWKDLEIGRVSISTSLANLDNRALNDLSDVNTSGVATGDFLQKSSGDWVDFDLLAASNTWDAGQKFRDGFKIENLIASYNFDLTTDDSFAVLSITDTSMTLPIVDFNDVILRADNMQVGLALAHDGDSDTKIAFTDDQIDLVAGGVTMLTLKEPSIAQDEVVINEGQASVNFRVESANQDDAIKVIANSDAVSFFDSFIISPTVVQFNVLNAGTIDFQLGDDSSDTAFKLDSSENLITMFGAIRFNQTGDILLRGDDNKIHFGAVDDCTIYWDDSAMILDPSITGGTTVKIGPSANMKLEASSVSSATLVTGAETEGSRQMLAFGSTTDYQNDRFMRCAGFAETSSIIGYVMMRAGSIVGVSGIVHNNAFTTEGTVDFEVLVNNTVKLSAQVNISANGQRSKAFAVQTRATAETNSDTFVAGDLIQFKVNFTGFVGTISNSICMAEIYLDT